MVKHKEIKQVRLTVADWQWLQSMKLKYNYSNLTDLISLLVAHGKESIKKGDLKLIHNGKK